MKMDDNIPAKVRTRTLLRRIFKASSLSSFLSENESAMTMPTFTDFLAKLCQERNMIREHVILNAGIDRSFGHQLFRGARKPSRDNVIRLAFGFGLTLEETQELLKSARKSPLYPKIKRDATILYGLAHHQTILEVQTSLSDFGLTMLGGEKYEHSER